MSRAEEIRDEAAPRTHKRAVAIQREDRCHSYNRGLGDKPEIPLAPPAWSDRDRPIMVDACIAAAVEHLWQCGHVTLGSCCGHDGDVRARPSLVLGQDERDFSRIRAALAEVDDRERRWLTDGRDDRRRERTLWTQERAWSRASS